MNTKEFHEGKVNVNFNWELKKWLWELDFDFFFPSDDISKTDLLKLWCPDKNGIIYIAYVQFFSLLENKNLCFLQKVPAAIQERRIQSHSEVVERK